MQKEEIEDHVMKYWNSESANAAWLHVQFILLVDLTYLWVLNQMFKEWKP